jgi:hypothetical protein
MLCPLYSKGFRLLCHPDRVLAGSQYVYDLKANDPDRDPLSYRLLTGPQDMTIDVHSGRLIWNPIAGDKGNQNITVQVQDNRGGKAEQSFVLSVIDRTSTSNRPPLIVSTPIVETEFTQRKSSGGRIIVANDEWTLSNYGFSNAYADTTQFVKNIANYFTDGKPGNFLGYSYNYGVTGSQLSQAFQSAGHQWSVNPYVNFTLETLRQYDGVFVGGFPGDNQVLIDYVNQGGNVYLFAGTAALSTAVNEANTWNQFLNNFGLAYDKKFNDVNGVIPLDAAPHPIFTGISTLFELGGNSIIDLDINDNRGVIVARSADGQGLYAIYDPIFSNSSSYEYLVKATDPDGDVLNYGLQQRPNGMWIEPKTGVIRWVPAENQVGTHQVIVKVTDSSGASTEQLFNVLVKPAPGNHDPIIISSPVTTGYSTAGYHYQIQALDPDQNELRYSLVSAPNGMTLNSSTGKLSWSNPIFTTVSYDVSVNVTDGWGGIDTQTFKLQVVPGSGEIRGSIFNDLNGDGTRSQSIGNLNSSVIASTLNSGRVSISNGFTELVVAGGMANNGLIPRDGYYTVTDKTFSTTPTWSVDPVLRFADQSVLVLSNGTQSGAFGAPVLTSDGKAKNSSTKNGIAVQSVTELIGSNVKTTFSFKADSGIQLDGSNFVFYVENDIRGIFNVADYTGSIGGNDLRLFQYSNDHAFTVQLSGQAGEGATLERFGSGIWTGWGTILEGGNFESALSTNGYNFATQGDLGLALGFRLSGTEASLIINYDSQPLPPEPPLLNRVVYIDANNNGRRDLSELSTLTDAQGNYAFKNLAPGRYIVSEELQPTWIQTLPKSQSYDVVLSNGQIIGGLDFANRQEPSTKIKGLYRIEYANGVERTDIGSSATHTYRTPWPARYRC